MFHQSLLYFTSLAMSGIILHKVLGLLVTHTVDMTHL